MKYALMFIDYFVPPFLDMVMLWTFFFAAFWFLKWEGLDQNVAAVLAAGLVLMTRLDLKLSVGKVERTPETKEKTNGKS